MTSVRLARRAYVLPVLASVAAGAFVLSSPPAAARACDAATALVTQAAASSKLAVTLPARFQTATPGNVIVTQGGHPLRTVLWRPVDPRLTDVVVVADVSARSSALAPARAAAVEGVLSALPRATNVGLVATASPPLLVQPLVAGPSAARRAAASLGSGGGGAILDAVELAIGQLPNVPGRHQHIVVVAAGRDESRTATWAEARDLLSHRGIGLDVLDLSAERAIPGAGAQCPAPPVAAQPLGAGHEVGAAIAHQHLLVVDGRVGAGALLAVRQGDQKVATTVSLPGPGPVQPRDTVRPAASSGVGVGTLFAAFGIGFLVLLLCLGGLALRNPQAKVVRAAVGEVRAASREVRRDPSPPGSAERAEAVRRLADARQDLRAALGAAPTARALAEESAYLEASHRDSERELQEAAEERARARDRAAERRDRARRHAVELMAVERANQERLGLARLAQERAVRARDRDDDTAMPRTTYSVSAYHEQVEAENLRADAAREAADALARAQDAEAAAALAAAARREAEDDAREAEEAAARDAKARDSAQRARIRAEREAAAAAATAERERRKAAEAERRRRLARARAEALKRSRSRKAAAKKARTAQRVSRADPQDPVGAAKDQAGAGQVIDLRPGGVPDRATTTTPPVDRGEPVAEPAPGQPGRIRQQVLRAARPRQVRASAPDIDLPALEKIRVVQVSDPVGAVEDPEPHRTRQDSPREARPRQVTESAPDIDLPALEKIRVVQVADPDGADEDPAPHRTRQEALREARPRQVTVSAPDTDPPALEKIRVVAGAGLVGAVEDSAPHRTGQEELEEARPRQVTARAPDKALEKIRVVGAAELVGAVEDSAPHRTGQEELREARPRQVTARAPDKALEKIRVVGVADAEGIIEDPASTPPPVLEAASVAPRADLLRLVVYVPVLALLLRPLLHGTAWLGSASAVSFGLLLVAMVTAVVGARLYWTARAGTGVATRSQPGPEPVADPLVVAADTAVAELRNGAPPADVWAAFETSTGLSVPAALRDVVLVRQDPDALLRFAGVARPGSTPSTPDREPQDFRARAGMLLLLVGSVGVFLA